MLVSGHLPGLEALGRDPPVCHRACHGRVSADGLGPLFFCPTVAIESGDLKGHLAIWPFKSPLSSLPAWPAHAMELQLMCHAPVAPCAPAW